MKIALAAVGFINGATDRNKQVLMEVTAKYSNNADMVVFGETFLQGFDALSWDYERDKGIGVSVDGPIIAEIRECAKAHGIAVSFGYIERVEDALFSSQMTIDADGIILDNFRRLSKGWKVQRADCHYREGTQFARFVYHDVSFAVGLCGDLWYEENAVSMKQLDTDVVLWPVYTDFPAAEWNGSMKYEYAGQAARFGRRVLYVNSVCRNPSEPNLAKGGAAFFQDGRIIREIPAGNEGVLIVEL